MKSKERQSVQNCSSSKMTNTRSIIGGLAVSGLGRLGVSQVFELHLCDACADFRLVLLRRLAAQRLDS
jgi:hypothetical protein